MPAWPADRTARWALLGSALIHGAAVLSMAFLGGTSPRRPAVPPQPWESAALSGATFDVDALAPDEGARAAAPTSPHAPAVSDPTDPAAAPVDALPASDRAALTTDAPPHDGASDTSPRSTASPSPPRRARRAQRPHRDRPRRDRPGADRPRPPARPSPAASGAAPAPAGSNSTEASGRGASWGAEGLPPGVRSLDAAFTRALPRATDADAAWLELPFGELAPLDVEIRLNEDGSIAASELDGGAAVLRRAIERTRLMLGAGRFALSADRFEVGARRYRITARLAAAPEEPAVGDAKPTDTVDIGFTPPRAGKPGRAHFQLRAGRRVEFVVEVLAR